MSDTLGGGENQMNVPASSRSADIVTSTNEE